MKKTANKSLVHCVDSPTQRPYFLKLPATSKYDSNHPCQLSRSTLSTTFLTPHNYHQSSLSWHMQSLENSSASVHKHRLAWASQSLMQEAERVPLPHVHSPVPLKQAMLLTIFRPLVWEDAALIDPRTWYVKIYSVLLCCLWGLGGLCLEGSKDGSIHLFLTVMRMMWWQGCGQSCASCIWMFLTEPRKLREVNKQPTECCQHIKMQWFPRLVLKSFLLSV